MIHILNHSILTYLVKNIIDKFQNHDPRFQSIMKGQSNELIELFQLSKDNVFSRSYTRVNLRHMRIAWDIAKPPPQNECLSICTFY